ncbi:MAG: 6-bladed beta-propeller [Bacteroidales bacterium]|nr:6-bladed beta-propeller [Bacteroidales bacterium]
MNFTPDQFIEKEKVLLDTIVDKIEYVMLETGPDSYIGRISSLFITEDEILLISQGNVFIFDRTGRFKTKLGAGGEVLKNICRLLKSYIVMINILFTIPGPFTSLMLITSLSEKQSTTETLRELNCWVMINWWAN